MCVQYNQLLTHCFVILSWQITTSHLGSSSTIDSVCLSVCPMFWLILNCVNSMRCEECLKMNKVMHFFLNFWYLYFFLIRHNLTFRPYVNSGEYIPKRENALSGGCAPILIKFAPSSCYTQQSLGKKKCGSRESCRHW